MSAQHTPGPWSLPHFAEPAPNCRCGYVLTDQYMGAVATVHCSGDGADWASHGDNPKFREAVANAHLIAAAPDLLAALTDIVNCKNSDCRLVPDHIAAARQAIAKATGRDE